MRVMRAIIRSFSLGSLMHTFGRLHSIPDRQDHVEVVVLDLSLDNSIALGGNCRKFCDSWNPLQLLAPCITHVLADGLDVAAEQRRKLLSRQPDRFTVGTNLKARRAIRRCVDLHLWHAVGVHDITLTAATDSAEEFRSHIR